MYCTQIADKIDFKRGGGFKQNFFIVCSNVLSVKDFLDDTLKQNSEIKIDQVT